LEGTYLEERFLLSHPDKKAFCLLRNREQFPFWQNYAYEQLLPAVCYNLALFAKLFKA
jgi:hypothetical protein